jgi:transcriptional regulator with XRE-family HTH domain
VQTKVRTKLAEWRIKRRVTQEEMIAATGLSRSAYLRLEHGHPNPPVRWLANCALALDCQIDDLLDEQHRGWLARPGARRAPRPGELWREVKTPPAPRQPVSFPPLEREVEKARRLEFQRQQILQRQAERLQRQQEQAEAYAERQRRRQR